MARLPVPGSDDGTWGTLMNEFLRVSHREDGSLRGVIGVVNVKDFGAVGDDLRDSAAIQEAITYAESEGSRCVVFFPPGVYSLTDWSTYIVEKSLTLLAHEGTATLIGPGLATENHFLSIRDSVGSDPVRVVIDGLSFENWGRTIVTSHTSPIEQLSVRNCAFNSINNAIDAWGAEPDTHRISYVSVENCVVKNSDWVAISVRSGFDTAMIVGNRISDCRRTAIQVGNTNPAYRNYDDEWKKATISHNACTNLVSELEGMDIHGVIAAGREIIVTHNHIEQVQNGGESGAEGIYLKARYSEVSHNTLVNAGGNEGVITIKGTNRDSSGDSPRSYAIRICENMIRDTRDPNDSVGIRTYNGDMMIVNNYIESLHSGIKVTDRGIGGHLISGNILRDVKLGIKLWGLWVRTVVAGNNIYLRPAEHAEEQRDGIALQLTHSSGIADCVIKGNSIYCGESTLSGLRGISIWCTEGSSDYPVNGLVIANNQLTGLNHGIWSKRNALPAFDPNGMWIHGNYFRECPDHIAPVLTDYGDGVIIQDNLVTE